MKNKTFSPTALASVLCGIAVVLAGILYSCIESQRPCLLLLMAAVNLFLHLAVWYRAKRVSRSMPASLSIAIVEAFLLVILLCRLVIGQPDDSAILAMLAMYMAEHGASLLVIPTVLSRLLGIAALICALLLVFSPLPALVALSMISNGMERLIMALVNRNDHSPAARAMSAPEGRVKRES